MVVAGRPGLMWQPPTPPPASPDVAAGASPEGDRETQARSLPARAALPALPLPALRPPPGPGSAPTSQGDRGQEPDGAGAAHGLEWTNRDPRPPPFTLDPRDLRALAELIAANALGESSSTTDQDDGDGVLEPLEVGMQRWRGGRLVALLTGEDRYGSFGYGLHSLPPSIGDLDALEELDLNTNRLATLPDAIGELRGLRALRLHRNGLEALPETIGSLHSLRELIVGENALRELPPAIAGLGSLEELHANDNPLAALPEAIGLLPRLRILNVSHSGSADPAQQRLAALPRSLDARTRLETLHIAGNRLFCAGGESGSGLVPEWLRDGSIPRLHGLLAQDCGVHRRP